MRLYFLEFVLGTAIALQALKHIFGLRLGERLAEIFLVQLYRVVPRHQLAFEYVIRLFSPAFDLYMPYFVQDNRQFNLG